MSCLGLAGALVAEPVWAGPPALAIVSDALGSTIKLSARFAPYPSQGGAYDDATVFLFVPKQARLGKSKRVDFVVHLHGHNTTAEKALKAHKLREQVRESKQSAVLVVPQGPVNAADGDFGKLMLKRGLLRLLDETRQVFERRDVARALGASSLAGSRGNGRVVLSAHSGGYRAAAAMAQRGGANVREIYLFDALYGELDAFGRAVTSGKKLVSYHVGGAPRANSEKLASELKAKGVDVRQEQGSQRLTREDLVKGDACFLMGHASHATATFEEHALRDCLLASCLVGRGSRAWHRDKDKTRST